MQRRLWLGRDYVRLLAGLILFASVQMVWAGELDEARDLLLSKSFKQKSAAVDVLANSGDPSAAALLNALLNGRLYYVKKDRTLIFAEKQGREVLAEDALKGGELGTFKSKAVKKITVNNAIRGQIRTALAMLELSHQDPDVRLAAVERIFERGDADAIAALADGLNRETDPVVRDAMETALAVSDLHSPNPADRLAALKRLADEGTPALRAAVAELAANDPDAAVQMSAAKTLRQIDLRIQLYGWAENIFFGLSLGSVLVLAAIGLAITFGVMGVINMAHGELIMIGAYTTYVIQQLLPGQTGLSVLLAIPAAFVVSGLVGVGIERGVIRFLYGRPLETLLATFGISLVLQQTVRTIFSPLNRSVSTPDWMSGSIEINGLLSLTLNRMYILLFCLLVFLALYAVLKRTPLGLQVRAVSQNRPMARAMGVRAARVDALTFGLGAGIAGVAGVALSQLTNVGPNLGQSYIVDSFMVVVFGGVGNLWGTLVGGLGLGIANKFLEPWSGAVLAKILVLVFIILFIQKRPRGLFPQRGRAVES